MIRRDIIRQVDGSSCLLRYQIAALEPLPLHVVEAPGAGPPLVILHGLTGSHAEFVHLVPGLCAQAQSYLLDLRGHGQSGRVEQGYHLADYGRDVATFVQQVVRQPAVLLGHSLGGLVALWVAANAPHLLRGLVLAEPLLTTLQMPHFRETAMYAACVSLRSELRRYYANGASLEQLITFVEQSPVDVKRTMLDSATPEAVCMRALQLHQLDPAVLEPVLAGTLLDPDQPDALLTQVSCPVHLLVGQAQPGTLVTVSDVQRALAQMPHATHTSIAGAGHALHLEQPEAVVHEVVQFLVRLHAST